MVPYWIQLHKLHNVCVEAASKIEACQTAERETGGTAVHCDTLPYPAEPRVGPRTDCPSFCYSPEQCKGRTACPRNYSCTE